MFRDKAYLVVRLSSPENARSDEFPRRCAGRQRGDRPTLVLDERSPHVCEIQTHPNIAVSAHNQRRELEKLSSMLKLHVITVSTRPTRIGPKISKWFYDFVCEEYADSFDTELVDLADFGLPVFNEPKHPRIGEYEHEHSKAWSRSVDAADAFAFVSPEYNYGPPPSFVNAVTYLSNEWQYKPAAFVSYGGVAAGLRGRANGEIVADHFEGRPAAGISTYPDGGATFRG